MECVGTRGGYGGDAGAWCLSLLEVQNPTRTGTRPPHPPHLVPLSLRTLARRSAYVKWIGDKGPYRRRYRLLSLCMNEGHTHISHIPIEGRRVLESV